MIGRRLNQDLYANCGAAYRDLVVAESEKYTRPRELTKVAPDDVRLRLAFVVYGAMNIEGWRRVSIDRIAFDEEEPKQNLIPVLRQEIVAEIEGGGEWAKRLVAEAKVGLQRLLPLNFKRRPYGVSFHTVPTRREPL